MKRPAFQFYPGDWQRDAALRSCSVAARGLWIEMMAVMHQAEPYGFLVLNEKAIANAQLARMVGATEKEVNRWMAELDAAAVYSKDEKGLIFSRRMVRDEKVRQARAAGGEAGADHGHKGALDGAKGGRPRNAEGSRKPPLEPAPSSSSSSSPSTAASKTAKEPNPSAAPRRREDVQPVTVETWQAYARAYQTRYGVAPLRNAKVNGMLAQFLNRVPQAEAPDIAEFYVGHDKGLYVSSRHCIDLMLRDAEGLRTEWATGRKVTEGDARRSDRTAGNASLVNDLLAEAGRHR